MHGVCTCTMSNRKNTPDNRLAKDVLLKITCLRPPDKSHKEKLVFLFLNQNICCGYSKEPSH